ncbi:hypothetical protein ABFB09_01975 [Dehalogenimonas sp. THU2]|uniref:hypothetical protein n=1 Tax=Dehalogenimonas sp. THU2 TaxID=3151121 RepID=UPI0032186047
MMRPISTTLLDAQRSDSRAPYVKAGVKRRFPVWQSVYTGTESDAPHAAAFAADGSMIRARLTPPADSRKLYRQRTAAPGIGADFSQWVYTGESDAVNVAVAAYGSAVSIVWIKSDRGIRRMVSGDNGLTWSAPELIDYTPTTAINGLAAAYEPTGNLAVFFADQATLYVKRCIDGAWQTRTVWNKTTSALTGVACVYDGDYNLMLTGRAVNGDYRLWSLVYGGDGSWGNLIEIAASPSGEPYEFRQAFLDRTDVYRCSYVEKYTGTEPSSRVYLNSTVPGAGFGEGLWTEPQPFDAFGEYGLALIHGDDAMWLASAVSLWRAATDTAEVDITADIKAATLELEAFDGKLTLRLDNAEGRYNESLIEAGDEVALSPGYITESGIEVSGGLGFTVTETSRRGAPGESIFTVEAADGWTAIRDWQARSQLRWNGTLSIKDILAWLLGRVGLRLETVSASEIITTLYPDFSINPGGDGMGAVKRLLSEVPDKLFIEGGTACLVNPLPDDAPVYAYGTDHVIFAANLVESGESEITTPPNCGQQLHDIVEIANLDTTRYRITAIKLDYQPDKGKHEMKLRFKGA